MTNITFFFLLIPFLALALLIVNFIFASHTPYQEKNSTFECGFHSFLGQNRMQFNISFYIFGLLFLLFDLEILLIYPYPVSAQFNSLYGLIIMLIFFSILTLGFTFELGKNALKIDSRQYDIKNIIFNLNNNNHNLLNSGLFNKPKILFNKYEKFIMNLLSVLIVMIFFTFAFKFFIFKFQCIFLCILSGIISVIGLILKSIILPCLVKDTKQINDIMNNKRKFILDILIRFILILIITYFILFVLASLDKDGEFHHIFYGVLLCESALPTTWLKSVNDLDDALYDNQSRFRRCYDKIKSLDKYLNFIKGEHMKSWWVENNKSVENRSYQEFTKNEENITKQKLNKEYTAFVKQKGDLKKSATRLLVKFESLPDNHSQKEFYLDKVNGQMQNIKELGSELDNKRVYTSGRGQVKVRAQALAQVQAQAQAQAYTQAQAQTLSQVEAAVKNKKL